MTASNDDAVRRTVAEMLGKTIRTSRDGLDYVTWNWSRNNPDDVIGNDLILLEQIPLDDATAIECLQALDKVNVTRTPFEIEIKVCAQLPARIVISACVSAWQSLTNGD